MEEQTSLIVVAPHIPKENQEQEQGLVHRVKRDSRSSLPDPHTNDPGDSRSPLPDPHTNDPDDLRSSLPDPHTNDPDERVLHNDPLYTPAAQDAQLEAGKHEAEINFLLTQHDACALQEDIDAIEKAKYKDSILCTICGKIFTLKSSLKKHQVIHTGLKPYQCNICGKSFPHTGSLTYHKRSHTGERPYACDICGKSFTMSNRLKRHKLIHTDEKHFECKVCGKLFRQRENLNTHSRTHSRKGNKLKTEKPKPHTCTKGNKLKTGKEKPKRHACTVCGEMFATKKELTRHHKTHTEDKRFDDSECRVSSEQKTSLIHHEQMTLHHQMTENNQMTHYDQMMQHSQIPSGLPVCIKADPDAPTFICVKPDPDDPWSDPHTNDGMTTPDQDDSAFASAVHQESLEDYDESLYTPAAKNEYLEAVENEAEQEDFLSDGREEASGIANDLKSDRDAPTFICVKPDPDDPWSDDDISMADQDDSTFPSSPNAKKLLHDNLENNNETSYTPDAKDAGKIEMKKKPILEQAEIVFPPDSAPSGVQEGSNTCSKALQEESLTCTICDKKFTLPSSLKKHQVVHTGLKPYQCNICGKSFPHSGSLTYHKRIHTGEKPYKCDICGKAFSFSYRLDRHILIHTGEKQFQCNVCGKFFRQREHLTVHSRTHIGDKLKPQKEKPKPHACTVCGKKFATPAALLRHNGTHSEERRFSCSECGKSFKVKGSLKQHSRLHTGEKPYGCSMCGMMFAVLGHLSYHQKTKH